MRFRSSPQPSWASQTPKVDLTPTASTTEGKTRGRPPRGRSPGTPTGGVPGWVFWNWHSIEWRVNEFGVRDERLAGLTR
jgi:hypothetical protein